MPTLPKSPVMGQMMSQPLLISNLIVHADRHFGGVEIVSRRVEGDLHRYTYHECHTRSRLLANALARLGIEPGDRVGTLAWNGYRHMETYYAVSGSGAVLHTLNPRLALDQLAYIVNHAEDQVLLFDLNLLPLVEAVAPQCPTVRTFILFGARDQMPGTSPIPDLRCYEDLLEAETDAFEWPQFDEEAASSLCYTSGTTGHPKGVLYSHRSTLLHSYATALPDCLDLSAHDTLLPVVPMFHVNAWGLPYSAALTGAKLVLPGPHLDGKSLFDLFEQEQVTLSAGVPTVWLGLLNHVAQQGLRFSSLKRTIIGGSTCPPSMIKTYREQYGVEVVHAWGMTELSPVGTTCTLFGKHKALPPEAQQAILEKQGHAVFGVDMRIVDDQGLELPWDGATQGQLQVRGPWTISSYYRQEGEPPLVDGWFPTGDVATIDPDGFMQITDRTKDLIKSGGEWISSIDLENIALAHPAVQNAAAIAIPHPKWDERPFLVVVLRPGATVTKEDLLAFYQGKLPKWEVPDDVAFVETLPIGATGKVQKNKLRELFKAHQL